jgi:Glutathione S-transferase
LDNGECLSESNAILNYLADGTDLLPTAVFEHAKVLQWQFFEQYSHEQYHQLQGGGHKTLKGM